MTPLLFIIHVNLCFRGKKNSLINQSIGSLVSFYNSIIKQFNNQLTSNNSHQFSVGKLQITI